MDINMIAADREPLKMKFYSILLNDTIIGN